MYKFTGTIIRMPMDGISRFSRAAQGVRIMHVKENEKVVSITKIKRDEEEMVEE